MERTGATFVEEVASAAGLGAEAEISDDFRLRFSSDAGNLHLLTPECYYNIVIQTTRLHFMLANFFVAKLFRSLG